MDDQQRPMLGEILLKRKTITPQKLEHALQVQAQEKNGFIGEILMKLGYVEERDIVVALVLQCGLPYIAVNKYTIDPSVVRCIPKEFAQQQRLIALDKIGDILSVVMTNPLGAEKKAELEKIVGCKVATFISTQREIEEAIAKNYS